MRLISGFPGNGGAEILRLLLLAVWVFALSLTPSASVRAKPGDVTVASDRQKNDPTLVLTQGRAEIVDVGQGVSDIMVANPALVDVSVLQSDKLYIVGLALGSTNIVAMSAQGDVVKRLNVQIKIDDSSIKTLIRKLYPKEDIQIDTLTDQVVLHGRVSSPQVASKVASIVSNFIGRARGTSGTVDETIVNMLEVEGDQQVMLRVKILEASRQFLREIGVNVNANDPNELSAINLFGNDPPSSLGGTDTAQIGSAAVGLTSDPIAAVRFLRDSGINGLGMIELTGSFLEDEGLIHILAEPNLTAVSGQEAGFLAGGEFPVPVGRDQVGNLVIEFREFGVSLNFKPVVLSDGRISLQLQTEVSSLDFANSVNTAGAEVPALDVRRASTTVELASGSSLMIAGLLRSETTKGMAGLPGIRKTPILGDLISSESFNREETEMVVMISPVLVQPHGQDGGMDDTAKAAKPNPLARAFAANMERLQGRRPDLFREDEQYGYLLD